MGSVICEGYSYYYEDGSRKEEIFDYLDNISNYTRIPLHSFDNSVDTLFKEMYTILEDCYAFDNDLISALFFSFILLVNRHMNSPKPVRLACLGNIPKHVTNYYSEAIRRMHPDSHTELLDSLEYLSDAKYDILIDIEKSGQELSERIYDIEQISQVLSDNYRLILVGPQVNLENEKLKKYDFGEVSVYTCENDASEGVTSDYEKRITENVVKREIKTVASICPHDFAYVNYELTKDICVVPYLFHKLKGCRLYMVGLEKGGEYSLKKYVEGPKYIELDSYDIDSKLNWLCENGKAIDCLMLFGTYSGNMRLAKEYKRIRPDGVIYLGMDANAYWINNIPIYDKAVSEFYKNCDIKATTTRIMQKFILKKWGMDTAVVRMGYYPFGVDSTEEPDYSKKKKIVLAVGRVGAHQKRYDILLQAFAIAYKENSDWELRLVGPIEESFFEFLDIFFAENPYMEDAVKIVGPINDKRQLHEEYLQASIYALSSEGEEFTNAVTEAMCTGCAILSTKVDLYEEITNYGKCGLSSPIDDANAFAQNMLRLFSDKDLLNDMCRQAYINYVERHDYVKIIDRLYELLLKV
ncbi:glycosyltransferase family 4 protein [Butyrivibrio sp. YAB3001]|uniref:glycosyltransferase family 4 protein n=1 Tax=Butyrivibrio sp. YAB3001 TaxID=1520812 RepID=UPI0008F63D04|nr:glycosyltransferase family 4 protein [Butyrivibrio sp. YAB3001]SFB95220.1 Glycosyl transferases group 1 [Butyrivibrio sp. YAB3001]